MVAVEGGAVVLALNSGSSSLKYGLYAVGSEPVLLVGGTIETADDHARFFDTIETALTGWPTPTVIGHRIVHGGPHRDAHCRIDDAVMADLEAACAFAPLHGPASLALIRAAEARYPAIPQVACFDTAFHAGMPDIARKLPIPREYQATGVRRYGFHGLSCESIVRQLGDDRPDRLVIAHLGNGASVTAVRDGRSIDTSMGLTPSGGVMMATRTGDIDPGVLLYLAREAGLDGDALARLVDHGSGMAGVSGLSGDMRVLRASSTDDADLAIRMFERSVCKQVAAMIVSLGGADMLVLTGGIGENDVSTARAIRAGLAWLPGLGIRILPSQEDAQIARHAAALLIEPATTCFPTPDVAPIGRYLPTIDRPRPCLHRAAWGRTGELVMNAIRTEMLYFQRRLDATQVMAAAAAGPCARVAHETLAGLYADTLATLAAQLECLIAEPPLTFASRALRSDRSVGLRVLRTAMPRSRLMLKLAC